MIDIFWGFRWSARRECSLSVLVKGSIIDLGDRCLWFTAIQSNLAKTWWLGGLSWDDINAFESHQHKVISPNLLEFKSEFFAALSRPLRHRSNRETSTIQVLHTSSTCIHVKQSHRSYSKTLKLQHVLARSICIKTIDPTTDHWLIRHYKFYYLSTWINVNRRPWSHPKYSHYDRPRAVHGEPCALTPQIDKGTL